MNESKRSQRGDAQIRGEVSAWFGEVLLAAKVGVGASLVLILVASHLLYPEGLVGFLKSMAGWVTYNIQLLLPQSQHLRISPVVKQLAQDWVDTKSLRYVLLGSFGALWLATSFVAYRLILSRGKAGAEGKGLRDGEQRLAKPSEVQKAIKKLVNDPTTNHRFTSHDLFLSDSKIRVPDKVMSTSTGIIGDAGTGKTTFINQALKQILGSSAKAFVIDANGEFYARFGRPGDVILSVFDNRAAKWDFWSEGLEENKLAAGLVEFRDDMSANEKYFQGNGLALLAALLRNSGSLPELWQLAMRSVYETKAFLDDRNDPYKTIFSKIANDSGAVFSTAVEKLRKFLPYFGHHVKMREEATGVIEEAFSINRWVRDDADKRSVFIVASDEHWSVTQPLVQLWTHIATYSILQRMEKEIDTPITVFADEVSSVGYVPSVPLLMDRGRKYMGRVVLGFHTLAQLRELYGQEGASKITTGLQNLFVFATKDPQMAEFCSKAFSSREVERSKISQNLTDRGGSTLAQEIVSRPVVTASQFQSLPERTAYVRLVGLPPTKLYWTAIEFPFVHKTASQAGKRPAKAWIEGIEVSYYRSLRDQERFEFLDELKATADEFLSVFHKVSDPSRVAKLALSIKRCQAVLAGAATLKEDIDGESYEIAENGGFLIIVRGSTKVALELAAGEESKDEGQEEAESLPLKKPEGKPAEEEKKGNDGITDILKFLGD